MNRNSDAALLGGACELKFNQRTEDRDRGDSEWREGGSIAKVSTSDPSGSVGADPVAADEAATERGRL